MTEWRPDELARRLPYLQERARIQAAWRDWFVRERFIEVETPTLRKAASERGVLSKQAATEVVMTSHRGLEL